MSAANSPSAGLKSVAHKPRFVKPRFLQGGPPNRRFATPKKHFPKDCTGV